MLDHTHLKLHDNTVASMCMKPNETNKQNNSTLSGDTCTLLFRRMLGMPDLANCIQQIHYLAKASIDI